MLRKRPCRVCGRWFRPDARVGSRQHTCGLDDCQRERHRRACAAWRKSNPDYDREDRLRRRVRLSPTPTAGGDPTAGIDWARARDEIGLQVAVIIEESGKVLGSWMRDEMSVQVGDLKRQFGIVAPRVTRDEMAPRPAAP